MILVLAALASLAAEPHPLTTRLHAGAAYRVMFDGEAASEPFLVAGPGILLPLGKRVEFVSALTLAVAPTGTWGPGLTGEIEVLLSKRFGLVGQLAAYAETRHGHGWNLLTAGGLGASLLFPHETSFTAGLQAGVSPSARIAHSEWSFHLYPLIELAVPFPGKPHAPVSHGHD